MWECYWSVHKSVTSVQVAARVSFLKSSLISLSKEEVLVEQQHNAFKTFKVLLKLCMTATDQFPKSTDAFNNFTMVTLAGMHTQLHGTTHG
jgi:mannitol-specific phosphotransferase system IIBC component